MINYTNAKLDKLIIHSVGSKLNEEGYILSDVSSESLPKEIEGLLASYFLSPFTESEFHSFWHESELELNALYSFAKSIFVNKQNFTQKSKNIAKHLYEQSLHPRIKSGELYVSYFTKVILDNNLVDVIGIFKSETKQVFLQVKKVGNHFEVDTNEGININKIDKACLIFNTQDEGFRVTVIDNLNKSNEAQYWKNDFLKIKPLSDNYHFTKNILTATKDFIIKKLSDEYQVSKADKIELLTKSVNYFKENETFNVKEFEKEVFDDPGIIRSFRRFGSSYLDDNNIEIADKFEISAQAVKKQIRSFKSVIKLDKNFHIYIHGNRDLIEQGYDTKTGKKYYKIYFDQEA